jgi:hypothetical protein
MKTQPFSASRRSLLSGRPSPAGCAQDEVARFDTAANGGVEPGSTALTETSSSIQVDVNGAVTGGEESVVFSGPVQIRARTVSCADLPVPDVTLSIDLNGLLGKGQLTGKPYVTQSMETLVRPLAGARDAVEIGFTFHPGGSEDFLQYRVGMASFKLGFDVPSRKLVAAVGRIKSSTT